MQSGVYVIVHVESGKLYVGSAVNLRKRLGEHRRILRLGRHDSKRLQAAWNKYGESAFAFAVLQYRPVNQLLPTEQRWIDEFDATGPRGYNTCPVAGNCLGVKKSPEAIAKVVAAHKGKKLSPEHIAAIKAANTGRPKPPGFGARVSAAKKGTKCNHNGPDALAKISAALKGRRQSPELVAKRTAAITGRKRTLEQIARMREARWGKRAAVQGTLF